MPAQISELVNTKLMECSLSSRAVWMVYEVRVLLLPTFTLLCSKYVSLGLIRKHVRDDTLKAVVKIFCISNELRYRSLCTGRIILVCAPA